MKKIVVLISGLAIAGGVAAASLTADEAQAQDPHHGMFGGCDSAAKSAEWHKFHHFDKSAQAFSPSLKKGTDEEAAATSEAPKKKLSLEHYI